MSGIKKYFLNKEWEDMKYGTTDSKIKDHVSSTKTDWTHGYREKTLTNDDDVCEEIAIEWPLHQSYEGKLNVELRVLNTEHWDILYYFANNSIYYAKIEYGKTIKFTKTDKLDDIMDIVL
jgi:hypothetical protein